MRPLRARSCFSAASRWTSLCHRPTLNSVSEGEQLQFLSRESQRMGEGCEATSLWVRRGRCRNPLRQPAEAAVVARGRALAPGRSGSLLPAPTSFVLSRSPSRRRPTELVAPGCFGKRRPRSWKVGGRRRAPAPRSPEPRPGPGERAAGTWPRGGASAPRKRRGRSSAAPAAAPPPPPRKQCGASGRNAVRAGRRTPGRGQPSERAAGRAPGSLAQSHGRGAARGGGSARPGGAGGRGAGPGPPLAGTEGAGPGMRAPAAGSPSARRGAVPPSERARAGRRAAGGLGARRLPAPKM